jgi:hypothetical protein
MHLETESASGHFLGLSKRFTVGEQLDDGSIVDLVRIPETLGLQLVVWNGQEALFATSFQSGHFEYVPTKHPASFLAAVHFPRSIVDYGSTPELLDEISSLAARFGRVARGDADLLAYFVLSTWFSDVLPLAPFLWIAAPAIAPRERVMRLLALLCRRSLRVSEFALSTLQCIPVGFLPTLICETDGMSRALSRTLQASRRRDTFSTVRGEMRSLCCAKIVVANQPFDRSTLAELPLEMSLSRTSDRDSDMDVADLERTATVLQGKLLKFRLMNRADVASSNPDFPGFAAPLRTLMATVASPIWKDVGLRPRVASLFEGRDRESQAETSTSIEALVVEALLAGCHTADARHLSVLEITRFVNCMIETREGGTEMSPEKIGRRLRGLGIPAISLADGRRGVKLDDRIRRKVHELAVQWPTRSSSRGTNQNCNYCAAQPHHSGDGERDDAA